jgi:hypothetical protein
MRMPPPGSKNTMPKRPGESKTDYISRVNATKNTKPVRSGNDTPRPGTYGGVKGGASSTPRATSPVRPNPVRPGTSPGPGYGGGKPKVTPKGGAGGGRGDVAVNPVRPGRPTVTTPKPIKTPIRDGRGSGAGASGGMPGRGGPRDTSVTRKR